VMVGGRPHTAHMKNDNCGLERASRHLSWAPRRGSRRKGNVLFARPGVNSMLLIRESPKAGMPCHRNDSRSSRRTPSIELQPHGPRKWRKASSTNPKLLEKASVELTPVLPSLAAKARMNSPHRH